ncbi:MAG: RnfABCDGE type electron transport complex subunit G [Lachnoclostridium sp.]|nr:RnfABCDGE type electron transport complex subunit G [Lachnoclostridium sp.]
MSGAKSTLVTMIVSLGVITIVAGGLLAGVNVLTADAIAQANQQKQVEAIKNVATVAFDNDPVSDKVTVVPEGEAREITIFPLKNGDELTGAAVETYSSNGFSGDIVIMVGFDTEGDITGYEVVSHAETAGLGAKMQDWFRDSKHTVIGLNPGVNNLTVSKDGGDVDAITAATISSRAFLEALNRAYKGFNQSKDNL